VQYELGIQNNKLNTSLFINVEKVQLLYDSNHFHSQYIRICVFLLQVRGKQTIQMTYCKRFDNSCYHHQCIAIKLQWCCCRYLLVIQEKSAVKKWKTQKAVAVVARSIRSHMTQKNAGSKNAYYGLESKNTASQNIGAWDRMMTSYN